MTAPDFAPAVADPLEALHSRALVVFAPSERYAAFEQQQHLLRGVLRDFADRDVAVGAVLAEGTSRLGRRILAPDQAALLTARFGVGAGAFCTVLLDQDGAELARSADPIPPKVLFQRLG